MAWSTREIAELAGTTLRAVRHYHQVGLLVEPQRRSNGYKQYGVAHLVRLVRIRRLTELGFSLTQITDLDDTDEHPGEALRSLDAQLAATIDRLQRARMELDLILERAAPTDLPPDLMPPSAMAKLSAADRSLVIVMTRVLGPQGLQIYADLLNHAGDEPVALAFGELPADADEATRRNLVADIIPYIRALSDAHPRLLESRKDAPRGARFVEQTIAKAMSELYNPAQLDVLRRTREIMHANARDSGPTS